MIFSLQYFGYGLGLVMVAWMGGTIVSGVFRIFRGV